MKKPTYEEILAFYKEGRWNRGQVEMAYTLGRITAEERDTILASK